MRSRSFSFMTLTFLVATLPVAAGCRKSEAESAHDLKPEAAAPIAVKEVVAQAIKLPRTLTLSGSLIGSEEAKVAAGAAGKVVSTYVERGSVVRKGALLVRLDCQRTDQMFEKGAISKADYDRSRTQCETTKWSVSAAEAHKTLTSEALRDTEIKAPFAGMIIERFVSAGEYVRVDSPVVSLVDVDALRVELTVPEADVVNVK